MGMKQAIVLVHGFNVSDKGKRSIGQLLEPLQDKLPGVDVSRFGYKYTFVGRLAYRNKRASDRLAQFLSRLHWWEDFDLITLVAHSNGAVVADLAIKKSRVPAQLVAINPALRTRHAFADSWEKIMVLYSRCDWALIAGRVWSAAVRVLPWRWFRPHPWGTMGRVGYKGTDGRLINVRLSCSMGHSGALSPETVTADLIAQAVNRYRLEFDRPAPD